MNDLRRMADLLDGLDRRLTGVERERRLSNASLENAGLNEYDIDGQLVSRLGKQYDGTHTAASLAGPYPPTPTIPSAAALADMLLVRWDGLWDDALVAPMDFARVEVHVGASPDLTGLDFATLRGTIETARGGEVPVVGLVPDEDYWVRLTARSQSGKFGPASAVLGPVQVRRLAVEDLDLAGIGGNTIYRGVTAPEVPAGGHRIGDLWLAVVDPGDPDAVPPVPPQHETRRWDGDSWDPVLSQRATQAIEAAFAAQNTADAANAAALDAETAATAAANVAAGKTTTIRQPAEPSHTGRVVGDEWIDSDNDNLRHVWNGSIFVPAPIGNAAIRPQSLVLSDLAVTGSVNAALLEAILVLATTIVAGDPDGTHVRITPTGVRVFRADANGDGIPDEVIRFGDHATNDRFAVVRADGSLATSLDETGHIATQSLSVAGDIQLGLPDYTGRGGPLYEVLDRRARGYVAWGASSDRFSTNTTAGTGLFDIIARLHEGRMYKICVRMRVNSTADGDLAELQLRYTQTDVGGGTLATPNVGSLIAGRFHEYIGNQNAQGVHFEKLFTWGAGTGSFRDVRMLLCMSRPIGTGTLTAWGDAPDGIEMWIEDIGPYFGTHQTINPGGGGTVAPTRQRYSRTWICNWRQNWRGNNSFVDLPGAYQGPDPSGNNGVMKSYLGFSGGSLEDGQGMDAALSGATIIEVGLYLYYNHWYNNAGGSAVIGMHGFRNPAPSYGDGNKWMHGVPGWRRAEGRWISLGAYFPQNWATGLWKGIMLGDPGASSFEFYGRVDAENSATLNITYEK